MIFVLAIRSLLARPVRSGVLVGGFGLGVAVMAVLLGVGRVILEQAMAPDLRGGGDVVLAGSSGRLPYGKFILSSTLRSGTLATEVTAAAPSDVANLYLVDAGGATAIRARGGIPSLERVLRDPETSAIAEWTDTPADAAWARPSADGVLREIDRFHSVPDVPARVSSWAEWLYFNGRTADARFYLTFMAGAPLPSGRRPLGVRLQLEQGGVTTAYTDSTEVNERELLAAAPDVTIGGSRVRLVGHDYRISLDIPAHASVARVTGDLVVHATPGQSMPPVVLRGANGWVSGYVVPVMSGRLGGVVHAGREVIDFSGGAAYHDHNWGFWEGVSWQWGQVEHQGVSFVYGRVHPPADAADASRIPGFMAAIRPDGPMSFATNVTIEETGSATAGQPSRIVVRGRGESLDVTMDLEPEQTTSTAMRGSVGNGLIFFQLRARYRVTGQSAGLPLDFTALGSAETFRSVPSAR